MTENLHILFGDDRRDSAKGSVAPSFLQAGASLITTPPVIDERQYRYHYASEYLDRGLSVIPLIEKKPAVTSWKAYQERRPTRSDIGQWFSKTTLKPRNIGIVTGKLSGLIVVDCDERKSAIWWHENRPPTPAIVTTGRGGAHFYYRYGNGSGNRTGILDQAIDLRGDGGYVVAPPSIHPNGKTYTWVNAEWDFINLPAFQSSWIDEPMRAFVPTRVVTSQAIARASNSSARLGIDYAKLRTIVSECGGIARVLTLDVPEWKPLTTSSTGQWRGPCPVHGSAPRSRTFSVNVSRDVFRCFKATACRASMGGNALDLHGLFIGLPLYEACLDLAAKLKLDLPYYVAAASKGKRRRNAATNRTRDG